VNEPAESWRRHIAARTTSCPSAKMSASRVKGFPAMVFAGNLPPAIAGETLSMTSRLRARLMALSTDLVRLLLAGLILSLPRSPMANNDLLGFWFRSVALGTAGCEAAQKRPQRPRNV